MLLPLDVEARVQVEARRVEDVARVQAVRGERILVEWAGEDARDLQTEHGHEQNEEQCAQNFARREAVEGLVEAGALHLLAWSRCRPDTSFPSKKKNEVIALITRKLPTKNLVY